MDEFINRILEVIKLIKNLENKNEVFCEDVYLGMRDITFLLKNNLWKFRIIIDLNLYNETRIKFYRETSEIRISDGSQAIRDIEFNLEENASYSINNMHNLNETKFGKFSFLFVYLLSKMKKISATSIMKIYDKEIIFLFKNSEFMAKLTNDHIEISNKNYSRQRISNYKDLDVIELTDYLDTIIK